MANLDAATVSEPEMVTTRVPIPDKPIEVSANVMAGTVPSSLRQGLSLLAGMAAAKFFDDGNVTAAAISFAPFVANVLWSIWSRVKSNKIIHKLVEVLPDRVAKYK